MTNTVESKVFLEPQETYELTCKKGVAKATASLKYMLSLGFLGGAFIGVGFLALLRVSGSIPKEFGGIGALLGASVFPIGLICILVGGGELVTGNMMAVTVAWFNKKISFKLLAKNMVVITFANLVGSLVIAYFLGHLTGLTGGAIAAKTISAGESKVYLTFWQVFFSAVGCNWLVGMAVWLNFAAKDVGSKMFGVWFPIMTFVAIGFQHLVANMFAIPAAMFEGANISVLQFIQNMGIVFLGNFVGAVTLVSALYTFAYKK